MASLDEPEMVEEEHCNLCASGGLEMGHLQSALGYISCVLKLGSSKFFQILKLQVEFHPVPTDTFPKLNLA